MADQNSQSIERLTISANTVLARSKTFWSGLSPQQRVWLVIGALITAGAATFAGIFLAGPNYKPLMSGLELADVQSIAAQLAAKKIPYKVGPDGTSLQVPATELDAARLEVASHDTPHSGRIGFEIFDKTSWGQTEFDEKVNYQRALEGELERTIQTIRNIKSARVHLVMSTASVFTDDQRSGKASVTLRLKSGSLSRDEVIQIAHLVAGSVDQLNPKDVVITDADANRTLGGFDGLNSDGDSLNDQLTKRLISTLAPVVGSDRIRATVNVEYETGSSEENEEKYDPTVSVPLSMQRTEESSGPSASGGVPGTSSNVPAAKTAPVNSNSAAGPSSKTESATYGVNKITRHEVDPAGGIGRITAAIVLDDAMESQQQNGKWVNVPRKRQPEELRMISELAQTAIGFDARRGDTISVQNLAFDRPAEAETIPDSWADKARKGVTDYSSVIRYAGLIALFAAIYFVMIRPIQKRVLSTKGSANHSLPSASPVSALSPSETASHSMAKRSLALKSELATFVRTEPEASAAAVRSWLHEEV